MSYVNVICDVLIIDIPQEHKQQLHITKWTEETHKKGKRKTKMRQKPHKNNENNNSE